MQARIGSNSVETCQGLWVVAIQLLSFCEEYNIDFNILFHNENTFEFYTKEWSDTHTFKFKYKIDRDYSEMGLINVPICTIKQNSIKITVDSNFRIEKFKRGSI